jgi:methyl-accepting chemotaxis protein
LREVNSAVNVMDRATQDNAAMVQQTTESSRALANQAASLNALSSQFSLEKRWESPVPQTRRAAA